MKFDKLCNIVLKESSRNKFKNATLIVGNDNPVFTPEDILRDASDPSKGTKLYLANKEEKVKGLEKGDPVSIRRQLRRVNWIARKMIKRFRGKEITMDKLTKEISKQLEEYQTKVLGWSKPDKANTGYETRVIGNLLLPPTNRTPQGKSVFMAPGMDPNAGPEQSKVKVPSTSKPRKSRSPQIKEEPAAVSAEDIHRDFEQMVQHMDAFFDDDLNDVIKAHASQGGTVKDILRDPAVKDVYDSSAVRDVIRGMVKTGTIDKDPVTGTLSITPEGSSLGSKIFAARGDTADLPAPVLDPDAELGDDYIEQPADIEDPEEAAFNTSVIPDEAPQSYGVDDEEESTDEPLEHEFDDDEEESEWWDD